MAASAEDIVRALHAFPVPLPDERCPLCRAYIVRDAKHEPICPLGMAEEWVEWSKRTPLHMQIPDLLADLPIKKIKP